MRLTLKCALKYVLTAFLLLGVAPLYSMSWFLFRLLTLFVGEKYYNFINDFFYGSYQKYLVFFFEVVTGAKIVLYGDCEDIFSRKENVIYFSNHQCLLDWVVVAMIAERGSSSSRTRYILKDSLKYIPMYGFHFKKHGYIYVKRGGNFESEQYVNQLEKYNHQEDPLWLIIYPEGHRLNPGKPHVISKIRQYALDHGLPTFNHLLTPRLKAFSLCVETLKNKIDAIYDVTIAFSTTLSNSHSSAQYLSNRLQAPSYLDLYLGGMTIHIHMKRIEFSQIPLASEDFQNWVYDRFKIKDRLLSNFYSSDENLRGRLGDGGKESKVNLTNILPHVIVYISALMLCFTSYYIFYLYIWSYCIVFVVTLAISCFFL